MSKPSVLRSRKFWLGVAGLLALSAVCLLCILRFGNPQWSRYIYIFQAYVWPENPNFANRIPAGYTGRAFAWYRNGRVHIERTFKDGELNGRYAGWYDDGSRAFENWFRNGKRHGKWTFWGLGLARRVEEYKAGVPHGVWKTWDERGRIESVTRYKEGRKIEP